MTSLYRVECRDGDGQLKWVEEVRNIVVNTGLDDLLQRYFKGESYTASFYVGLKGTGDAQPEHTLIAHAGWSEVTAYAGNRQPLVLGAVVDGQVDNAASPAEFTFTGSATVAGAFVATVEMSTAGVLYSVADFVTPRAVESGDVLDVTVHLTAGGA